MITGNFTEEDVAEMRSMQAGGTQCLAWVLLGAMCTFAFAAGLLIGWLTS